jgi:hypothetical protein
VLCGCSAAWQGPNLCPIFEKSAFSLPFLTGNSTSSEVAMNRSPEQNRRLDADRRKGPTSFWGAFRSGGRRMRNRRADEHRQPYFVDRFPALALALVLALLAFTVVDGVITLHLIDADCQEINPLMVYLISKGPAQFIIGKYVLTATGLPLLLLFKNYFLFGTRLRIGYFIPIFVLLYVALTVYQIHLLHNLS